MASCYSEEYKKLYDESQQAIECPKSSEIADKIDEISKIFDSMNLEWDDPVKTNFDEFKKSLVQILGKISASINTYLASAEDTYSDLSTTLGNLKKDDESYSYLLDHEPTKNKTVTTTVNGVSTTNTVETSEHIDWRTSIAELDEKFTQYILEIEPLRRKLIEVNQEKIETDLASAGISVSAPVFELPENATLPTNLSSSEIFTSDGSARGNAYDIWKFLASQVDANGNRILSDAAIAGVLGNMQTENSNFGPNVYEGSSQKNQAAKGYGLIQWTNYKGMSGGRRDQLFAAASQSGSQVDSLQFQCEYLWDEVFTPRENAQYNHSGNTDYYRELAANGFFTTDDPVVAARLFHNIVEASADSATKVSESRGGNAQNWYNECSGVSV